MLGWLDERRPDVVCVLDIKIRAVTSFLIGEAPRGRYEAHELTAAQFFAPGKWGSLRSPRATSELLSYSNSVSKLVAHLTAERSRLDDLDRYTGDPSWHSAAAPPAAR